MMKKDVFWGIFFVFMAVFIIAGGLGYFGDISVWTLGFTIFFAAWFIRGMIKLSWGSMMFSLAFIAILYDEMLGIERLTPFPVLLAALLATIGFNKIFKKKKNRFDINVHTKNGEHQAVDEQSEDEDSFSCEVAFGSSVKYINCQQLRRVNIDNAFGNLTVYFDNAKLAEGKAVVNMDTAFGKTVFYIPKDWTVYNNVSRSFGSVTGKDNSAVTSDNLLVIDGEVAFGNFEIVYV